MLICKCVLKGQCELKDQEIQYYENIEHSTEGYSK